MKRRFTEKEVAVMYGISLSKLRQDRILKKGLPYIKIGKSVRYRAEDLEKNEEMNFHNTAVK